MTAQKRALLSSWHTLVELWRLCQMVSFLSSSLPPSQHSQSAATAILTSFLPNSLSESLTFSMPAERGNFARKPEPCIRVGRLTHVLITQSGGLRHMLTSRQGRSMKAAGQFDVHPCHHSLLSLMSSNNQHRDQHRNSMASDSCSRISQKASDSMIAPH